MRRLTTDGTQLTEEFGILTGRWAQYADLGELPFGAMWCVVPPGARANEDCHPEVELAVVVNGSARVESAGATVDAPLGSAVLLDSYERHVLHNASATDPLVVLSLYWMPTGADQPGADQPGAERADGGHAGTGHASDGRAGEERADA